MAHRPLRFLSAEQVLAIHDQALQSWGGLAGGGHRGHSYEGVEAAVQAVKNSYYDRVEELAAAYAVYIVQGHVFLDGNKRAGIGSVLVFLHGNGMKMRSSAAQQIAWMIELQRRAEASTETAALVSWLAARIDCRPAT